MSRKLFLLTTLAAIFFTGCAGGANPTGNVNPPLSQDPGTQILPTAVSPTATDTFVPQPESTSPPPEPTADLSLEAHQRGLALFEEGQFEQAIAEFDTAILQNPNFMEAYYRRGVSKIEIGDYEAALADFNTIISSDANNPQGYNGRGIVNVIQGEFELALQDFNQAIALNPDYAEAYNNRAIAYGNMSNLEAAVADFTKAIELEPGDIDRYYFRALAYANLGQNELAIADFRKVLSESQNEEQKAKAEEFIASLGGVP
jgi:tetratricopeptide (TPR) repeat protein